MITVLALAGLILGAWSVRSICLKHNPLKEKIVKSVVSALFFLGAGGWAAEDESRIPLVVVVLLAGAAVQLFCNHRDKSATKAA